MKLKDDSSCHRHFYKYTIKYIRSLLILIGIVVLGAFLRFYKLDGEYVCFNDTFWRLTPALELSKGILPDSYGGMPGISFLFFPVMLIKSSVILFRQKIISKNTQFLSIIPEIQIVY